MNSKRKGSGGEREFAAIMTAAGFDSHRNDQRRPGGGHDNPDVSSKGLENLHFEVKRVEHLNISQAMAQAIADAAGRVPIVAHRKNRQEWLVTMRLTDFLAGLKGDRP